MAPLKIIGAGYGRTGTLSLCRALDILGYSCHHMEKMLLDETQDPVLFTEAYKSSSGADWDHIFRGYDAAVDWPAAAFWETLLKKYPDAKVILTVRDPESWYNSVGKTIHDWPMNDGSAWPEKMLASRKMARTVVKEGELKLYSDKTAMLEHYKEHITNVRRVVPKDQLLVFESHQGWEPLCKFLGIDPPSNIPYPHLNRGSLFRERLLRVKEKIEESMPRKSSYHDHPFPHAAVSEIAAWEEACQLL
ncbi:P-loop containing nucleoside triphosphate hydrolase protein [Aspergillus pseudotamarii]|uniref:P-loop containing nucleoside triphosphate hydrolase protein n=1 Tax=Aspergillus pseudotamarii TaxID=132259 RepID=A0A5N6T4X6_ASPPS|nr:P-loop containing nucleoside triphosphate hydrolase protein [Aspergillus pseudotamarii]KAE8141340.1 P-loop containing nucleoside triphosphate hydrolase protein [Aspergillus pseudotamarii]